MSKWLRRYWVVVPMLASMATQCDETPRGAIPTLVTSVDIVLNSVPAPIPKDADGMAAYEACLQRMDGLPNHLRPSWRANNIVLLIEAPPNVWTASFFDVPVDFTNTMTVHDTNECARDPQGNGHVIMGVTANGTVVDRVAGENNTLVFQVAADGMVRLPVVTPLSTP